VNVEVVPFRSSETRSGFADKLRKVAFPTFEDFWPNEWRTRSEVLDVLKGLQPDCVLPFAFDAVLYTHGYREAPRVAFQAEGPHINTYVNWKYDPQVPRGATLPYWSYSAQTLLAANCQERLYEALSRNLTIAAFAGPHYVEWARKRGLSNAVFITTPVPDPVGSKWRELRASMPRNGRCKILMIGHLHSTSNKSGLPLFFEEILPALERKWGADRFEIHIVGRSEGMPARFDRWRNHPALRFRGPVFPADQEFLSADVLLVPIPAKTGSRVRILNGFTYGCAIVAHSANALGIPELKDGENILMANSGSAIADQVIRLAEDAELRAALGANGRATYERYYTEEAGGQQYLGFVEEAIARHQQQRTQLK
jgi:glycosyltransferase involved in cell wall biosynthesis